MIPFFLIWFSVYSYNNTQITPNFRLTDFTPTCKVAIPVEYRKNIHKLAESLEIIQKTIGKKVKIVSGYRSYKCNTRVGGAKKSQHMVGKAIDIRVKGMSTRRLKWVIEKLIKKGKIPQGGVGLYRWHVHYDIRGTKARWNKRYKKRRRLKR